MTEPDAPRVYFSGTWPQPKRRRLKAALQQRHRQTTEILRASLTGDNPV
jgi:hypothetical protein